MQLIEQIAEWMLELRPFIMHRISDMPPIEMKADGSPVTEIDRDIESFLRDRIELAFPEDGIIGEEFPPHQPNAARQWIIDPIDGTRALVAGWPTYTSLLAVIDNADAMCSAMLQPVTCELWIATNEATYCNGKPVTTSAVTAFSKAMYATTSPLLFRDEDKPMMQAILESASNYQLGGDGYAYGKLANGGVDLIIESTMKPYDFVPLIPIVRGAGGIITDWQGKPLTLESCGDVVAAATEELHHEAITLLNAA